jgi:AraC-like DNA-binding protein
MQATMPKIALDKKELRFPRTVIEPVLRAFSSGDTGVTMAQLLERLGTTEEQFHDPAFSINGEQMVDLYHWLPEQTRGRVDVGHLLRHFSATSAGLAGMAALSASNVRESLQVAVRYLPLMMPVVRADLLEDSRHCRFTVDITVDLGAMERFLVELVVSVVNIISEDVMSRPVPRTIHFTHGYGDSEQARRHVAMLEQVLGYRVIMNSTFNGMEGNAADLDTPTRSPNEATFSTVKRILENEVATQAQSRTFDSVVRHELIKLANDGRHPSLEAFAEKMNLSPRTLVRKLASENTSFKQISNDVRFRLARELLEKTNFSIKQVATRAGFSNANSFSRAFKTQCGETPVTWRDRHSRKN